MRNAGDMLAHAEVMASTRARTSAGIIAVRDRAVLLRRCDSLDRSRPSWSPSLPLKGNQSGFSAVAFPLRGQRRLVGQRRDHEGSTATQTDLVSR